MPIYHTTPLFIHIAIDSTMGTLLLFFSALLLSPLLYCLLSAKENGKDRRPPLPPGPKGFPIIGNLLQLGPKPHRRLQALFKVYGPLIRIRLGSTEALVVASAAVARQFFGGHDVNFSNRPNCAIGDHMSFNYQASTYTNTYHTSYYFIVSSK